MFISQAYAQAAGGGGDAFGMFVPLILIFVVFYFLLIRPQQKKAKAHRAMLGDLNRGDRVVTSGGLIGTITRVIGETELALEIAEGVKVRVVRGMISDVLARGKGRSRPSRDDEDDMDETDDDLDDDSESDDDEQARASQQSG